MIQTAENKIVYNITGTTGNVYPFPIRFFKVSDVHVFVDDNGTETELARGKDYTIEAKADYSGGADITLITAPPIGSRLVIMRILPIAQTLNLPEQGKFPSTSMEIALDKLTMICQQLAEAIERSIKWSPGQDQNTPPNQLLIAALEAAKKILALYPDILKVATDVNNALAAAGVMTEDKHLSFNFSDASLEEAGAEMMDANRQLELLPRNLGGHTLAISLSGKLSEEHGKSLKLEGFYNGKVLITGSVTLGNLAYSALGIKNCTCPVELMCNISGTTGWGPAIYALNSPAIAIKNCSVTGAFYEDVDPVAAIIARNSLITDDNAEISNSSGGGSWDVKFQYPNN